MKEALELIRKQDVLDIIHRYSCNTARIEEGVLNLPIDEAECGNGWVSCSKRLPEIGQRVLLWVYGQVHIGERMGHKLFEKYDVFDLKNGTFESTKRIEAWMPLPAPFKPEKGE